MTKINFFSKNNLLRLRKFLNAETILAFDFDGTLSGMVPNPSKAKLTAVTKKNLQKLSRVAPIAIISGRGLDDLKRRIRLKDAYLIGNHGLEGVKENRLELAKAEVQCKLWTKELSKIKLFESLYIENKKYSISLHYRHALSKSKTVYAMNKAIRKLKPSPRIILGKCVFNLVPQKMPHKGTALLSMMKELKIKKAIFVGDDVTDEDVFKMKRKNIFSIRVGKKQSSKAHCYIKCQNDIDRMLLVLFQYFQKN